MLCAFGQNFASFEVADNPDESPRLALLPYSLRGIEGDFEDVPVDHMPEYLQSRRTVYHGLIEQLVEVYASFIFAVKQFQDREKQSLVREAGKVTGRVGACYGA